MQRRVVRTLFAAVFLFVTTALFASAADAGPFDKLKKKVETKAAEKTDQATDKAVDKAAEDAEGAVTRKEEEAEGETTEAAEPAKEPSGAKSGSGDKVSSVSTRFDFVSGDRVIFLDDFTQDELGEFPTRWSLKSGTFEIAELNGERWLRCVSDDGHIRMKVPTSLPEFWTLEFDALGLDTGSYLQVQALTKDDNAVWETMYPHGSKNLTFR